MVSPWRIYPYLSRYAEDGFVRPTPLFFFGQVSVLAGSNMLLLLLLRIFFIDDDVVVVGPFSPTVSAEGPKIKRIKSLTLVAIVLPVFSTILVGSPSSTEDHPQDFTMRLSIAIWM